MSQQPITLDERKALRRKAWWTVADFARYTEVSFQIARRQLHAANAALGNMLLRPSRGTNRKYGFYWRAFAQHDPSAFVDDPLETQRRLDAVEDKADATYQTLQVVAQQTGQNSRDIGRIRRERKAA